MHTFALILALACPPSATVAAVTSVQEPGTATAERIDAAVAALEAAAKADDAAAYAQTIRASVDALDKRVVGAIAKGLKHKDAAVSAAAVDTLGRMRHPESTAALTGFYKSEKKALTDDEPRLAELLKSIGRLGDPKGIETLVDHPFAAKTYPVIQARLLGLGNIRDAKAVEALFELLEKVAERDLDGYMADIRLALVQQSGQDLGDDPRQWKSWWQDAKKGYVVTPEAKPLPEAMRARWNEYWGLVEAKTEQG
jgi:HEAT repeat protein